MEILISFQFITHFISMRGVKALSILITWEDSLNMNLWHWTVPLSGGKFHLVIPFSPTENKIKSLPVFLKFILLPYFSPDLPRGSLSSYKHMCI